MTCTAGTEKTATAEYKIFIIIILQILLIYLFHITSLSYVIMSIFIIYKKKLIIINYILVIKS